MHDRKAEAAREVLGLIEPALQPSPPMQRHWNNAPGIGDQIVRRRSKQLSELDAHAASSFVLERMHNRAQRAFIRADSAAGIDGAGQPSARSAAFHLHADRSP
jgi:hypothetical protein